MNGFVLNASLLVLAQNAPAGSSKTLLQYIKGGGPIGYVIICLSIVAMALAIVHLIQIRMIRLAPPDIVQGLGRLLRENDVQGAMQFCQQPENDCFLVRVFGTALVRCSRSPFGFLELRSALEESGAQEVESLARPNDGIALIASIAPMLGLLGTVVGMVGAFDTINSTQGMAKPAELAGYISIALITTVQGLVVAIPCTAVFTYFRNRIERYAAEVAQITEGLAADLESSSGAGKAAPAAKPAPRPLPRPAAPAMTPVKEAKPA
jgi:biopolymer transport protein ExbB